MLSFFSHIDHLLFKFINQTIADPFLDFLCPLLRNARVWIPLYVILGIYLIAVKKKKTWIYVFYILIAFAISDSVCYDFLKPYFSRLRPCQNIWTHARLLLDSCGGKWGFPSNHASNHMAIALSIVLAKLFRSKWINMAWIGWALLIGFSQIYVGVHYPADILAGFLFGAAVAFLNFRFMLPYLNNLHKRFTANN